MPPNDLEAGLPNGSTRSVQEPHDVEKLVPDGASVRPSMAHSTAPSAIPEEATSRDFRNWWRRPRDKPKKTYAPPPSKEDRFELETFQNLVGIHFLRPGGGLLYPEDQGFKPANPMHDIFMPTKAAAMRWRNRGLYDRCLSQDIRTPRNVDLHHLVPLPFADPDRSRLDWPFCISASFKCRLDDFGRHQYRTCWCLGLAQRTGHARSIPPC